MSAELMRAANDLKEMRQRAEAAEADAKKWRDGYMKVADAICASSTGPDDLAQQARAMRVERDALCGAAGREYTVQYFYYASGMNEPDAKEYRIVALSGESARLGVAQQLASTPSPYYTHEESVRWYLGCLTVLGAAREVSS